MQKSIDVAQLEARKNGLTNLAKTLTDGILEAQKRINEYSQALQIAKGRLAQLDEVESWLGKSDPGEFTAGAQVAEAIERRKAALAEQARRIAELDAQAEAEYNAVAGVAIGGENEESDDEPSEETEDGDDLAKWYLEEEAKEARAEYERTHAPVQQPVRQPTVNRPKLTKHRSQ